MNQELEAGFYWVCLKGEWTIADYDAIDQVFYFVGQAEPVPIKELKGTWLEGPMQMPVRTFVVTVPEEAGGVVVTSDKRASI